jgi:hypothetical protein
MNEAGKSEASGERTLSSEAALPGVRNSSGELHCVDIDPKTGLTLPAVTWSDGFGYWWFNGKQHRTEINSETGLTTPAHTRPTKSCEWWRNGKWHRDDVDPKTGLSLPAQVLNHDFDAWVVDGRRHRSDGPAWLPNMYWWNGKRATQEIVVSRVTVVPWVLWVNWVTSQKMSMPKAVLDEVAGFAMPQMAMPQPSRIVNSCSTEGSLTPKAKFSTGDT